VPLLPLRIVGVVLGSFVGAAIVGLFVAPLVILFYIVGTLSGCITDRIIC
jgi:hypothetical protein